MQKLKSTRRTPGKLRSAAWLFAAGVSLTATFAAAPAAAQQQQVPKPPPLPDLAPPPPPPPPPPGSAGAEGDSTEPTVVIRYEGPTKIEEFSINGRHYATRVSPAVGPSYLLVDPDGTGQMTRGDDTPARRRPPQWTLFQFK